MPASLRSECLIITGGNGYIGSRLAELAIAEGRDVVVLGRTPQNNSGGIRYVAWKLGEAMPASALQNAHEKIAVIHLAHDWKNTVGPNGEPNYYNAEGTKVLLESSHASGVSRFVFVSSQSARKEALNLYGRVKWQIEQIVASENTISARVGLVYGGPKKGLFGLMCALVSKLPILPMICPHQQVQPIHLDEVCQGLLLMADNNLTGAKGLAGPQPETFGNVLQTIAREAYGKKIMIIPVPLSLALLGAKITSYIPFIPTVDKERILGLAGTRFTPCAEDLSAIGLKVQAMAEGLRNSILGRKALVAEGKILLRYILGRQPSLLLQRLYVRAVRLTEPRAGALGMRPVIAKWPGLLRFTEPLNSKKPLAKRLQLATTLVDASADGASMLLAGTRGKRLLHLFVGFFFDACAMPFRLLGRLMER